MTYPQDPYQQQPQPGGYDPYAQQQQPYTPPYGQDPYGQQQPYAQDPYAQQAYGYGGGGYDPYGYQGYGQPGNEGLAIGAMVTSLVGLVVCTLACPVGAILGHVALGRIRESGKQGRGMALTGVIVGWIGTALLVGVIILFIALGAAGELD